MLISLAICLDVSRLYTMFVAYKTAFETLLCVCTK